MGRLTLFSFSLVLVFENFEYLVYTSCRNQPSLNALEEALAPYHPHPIFFSDMGGGNSFKHQIFLLRFV